MIPKDMKNLPEFDEDNPQTKGVYVFFKNWPLKHKQTYPILRTARKKGFKIKEKSHLLEYWMFLWDKWYPISKAEKVCDEFKSISFVEYCEVDKLFEAPSLSEAPSSDSITSLKMLVFYHKPMLMKFRQTIPTF